MYDMCVRTPAQLAHHSRGRHAGEERGLDGARGRVQNHHPRQGRPRLPAANLRGPHRVRRGHRDGAANHRVALLALQGFRGRVSKKEINKENIVCECGNVELKICQQKAIKYEII